MVGQYPLDFDALKKGEEISAKQLSEITGKRVGTREFEFAVLGIQSLIHEKTGMTAKGLADGGLRILTDTEAAIHNRKLFGQHIRGLYTRHHLALQVDVENLSIEDRAKHDRALLIQSRYVSALSATRKSLDKRATKEISGNDANR